MSQTASKFFSVMVVGENPDSIMEKYSMDRKVEPYVKYKFLQAEKYKNSAIKVSQKLLEDANLVMLNPAMKQALEENLKRLNGLSTFDYYRHLTEGMYYNEDGDALSDVNPDGRWKTAHIGRNFSLPLITLDGQEVYSARKRFVDWTRVHLANQDTYKAAWEVVVEGREPETDEERKIYESMKDKEMYFSRFSDKDSYINYSTAYWNFAYVDENGWKDLNDVGDEQTWITSFYDKFVAPLQPEDLISIYECTTNSDI